jgi:hypothetical protein
LSGGFIFASKSKIKTNLTTNFIEFHVDTNIGKTMFIAAYIQPDKEGDKVLNDLLQNLSEAEEDRIIVVGDLNSRPGTFSPAAAEELGLPPRQSKDKCTNPRGKLLNRFMNENGWCIMNGSTEGDKYGETTFLNNNGASTIDIAISSAPAADSIQDFKVLNSPLSHHSPIELTIITADPPQQKKKKTFTTRIKCTFLSILDGFKG